MCSELEAKDNRQKNRHYPRALGKLIKVLFPHIRPIHLNSTKKNSPQSDLVDASNIKIHDWCDIQIEKTKMGYGDEPDITSSFPQAARSHKNTGTGKGGKKH